MCTRKVIEQPSLEVLKKEQTWHFIVWFSGNSGIWWKVGLYSLQGCFQTLIVLWFYLDSYLQWLQEMCESQQTQMTWVQGVDSG